MTKRGTRAKSTKRRSRPTDTTIKNKIKSLFPAKSPKYAVEHHGEQIKKLQGRTDKISKAKLKQLQGK